MRAPKSLKKQGKLFWQRVMKEYVITDYHDLKRLEMAGMCLDNLSEAEDQIQRDGMYIQNRYGTTVSHPALKDIKDMRLLYIKIIREMGLDLVTGPESRPPRQY